MTRFYLAIILCTVCGCVNAHEQKHSFYIFFKSNEAIPDSATTAHMDSLLKRLKYSSDYVIEINGHTDSIGSIQYNKELSFKRTQSIKRYISKFANDTGDIKVSWFGESSPAQENGSENGRQLNRRVVVTITTFQWESAKEMLEETAPKPEVFSVSAKTATEINSKSGIKLLIPEGAFEGLQDGGGDVMLQLTSAINKEDWLAHGLSTISNEGLLESGGMFKIDAFQGGNLLKLKEGKQINVEVPFEKLLDDMAIFSTTSDTSGKKIWKRNDEDVISRKGQYMQLPYLKIDSNALNKIIDKWNAHKFDISQFKYSIIGIPIRPTLKLFPPKVPIKPLKENMKIYYSDLQKRFLSKHSKEKVIDKEYKRVLKKYTSDSTIFTKKAGAYLKAFEKFRNDSISYEREFSDAVEKLKQCRDIIICRRLSYWQSNYYKMLSAKLGKLKTECAQHVITNPIFTKDIVKERMPQLYRKYRGVAIQAAYHRDLNLVDSLLGYKSAISTNTKSSCFFQELYQVEKESLDQLPELSKLFSDANATLYSERERLGQEDGMSLKGYYQITLGELDWINIDRLSKRVLNARLDILDDKGSSTFVIFEDANSIIQCYSGKIAVPENENITLISFSIRDGKPFYAAKRIRATIEMPTVILEYKPGRLVDVKAAMKTTAS